MSAADKTKLDAIAPGGGFTPLFIEHVLTLAEIQALGAVNNGYVPFGVAALPANARMIGATLGEGAGNVLMDDGTSSNGWRLGIATDLGQAVSIADVTQGASVFAAVPALFPFCNSTALGPGAQSSAVSAKGSFLVPVAGRTFFAKPFNIGAVNLNTVTAGHIRIRIYYFVDASLA